MNTRAGRAVFRLSSVPVVLLVVFVLSPVAPTGAIPDATLPGGVVTGAVTPFSDPYLVPHWMSHEFLADVEFSRAMSFPEGTFAGEGEVRITYEQCLHASGRNPGRGAERQWLRGMFTDG